MKLKKGDLLFLLLCLYISFLFAFYRCKYGDFVAYNGDFQNYNIFRRILSGQVQYRDFVNYLGVGCTIINVPIIAFFNNFGASVFITNFTACIAFCFIVFVAVYAMTSNRNKSYIITLICVFLAFWLLKGYSGGEFYYKYIYNVAFIADLGHSMRTTRGMLPYIVVAIYCVYKKIHPERKFGDLINDTKSMIFVSIIMGAFIPWSNDFGFANVGCYFIIVLLINIFYQKKSIICQVKDYALICASILVGFLITLLIVTKGSVMSYIKTTASIASYQFWYYQNTPDKYFTIYDYFKDPIFRWLTIIFFAYAFRFLYKLIYKSYSDKDVIRLFLLSTNYAATLVYVFGSGHHNYYMLQLIVYIVVADTIIAHLKKYIKLDFSKYFKPTVIICMCALIILCSIKIIPQSDMHHKEYINGLNINTVIGQGLNEKADLLKGEEVFSTYATAIETINETFQPTGTDYIIHVLGDDERKAYVDDFTSGNYKYATTLKNDYTTWEYWAIRSNWFFYRELYKKYRPVDQTLYSIIWEKTDEDNLVDVDVDIQITKLDECTSTIEIVIPEYYDDVYVDLKLSYNTGWTNNRLKEMALKKCVSVSDGGEKYNYYYANSCYYIKEDSDAYYIPVYVTDGKAQIKISSNPVSCTKLTDLTATVEGVIAAPTYSLNVACYTDLSRSIIEDATKGGRVLRFVNTETNYELLKKACKLKISDRVFNVEKMDVYNDFILVHLCDEIPEELAMYPNKIEVACEGYQAANISDEHWISGIKRDESIVLFENNYNFAGLKYLKKGDRIAKVEEVIEHGPYVWVRIKDEKFLRLFGYPNYIEFVY